MVTKVSNTSEFSNQTENNLSDFGTYQLKDELILNLPNNVISLHDLGNAKFSYTRKSQSELVKKIIQIKPETQIQMAPVLPIHTPSYKTDFFFLRFTEPLFITSNSTAETTVSFPIEIGMFLVDKNKPSGFDFFNCDDMNSRFGLYGTPEDGKLCKYAITSLDDKQVYQPFIHTQFKIEIINELDEAASVGKIVFPATDHDLYYNGNKVEMDGLQAIIKNRVGLHVIETVQNPIMMPSGWSLAARSTEKTDYKFSMEKGFD